MGLRLSTLVMVPVTLMSSGSVAEAYLCDDQTRLTALFRVPKQGLGSVELVFAKSDERINLPQVASADGARYAAGVTEFWVKGTQARLKRADKATTCRP